jgi:2,3-diaminopropionate biosynthesis protein SbnA
MTQVGNTPLAPIALRIHGRRRVVHLKLEGANPCGSLKDRTAQSLIDELEQRGALGRGSVLLESTSGNLGVALAWIARRRGYRFVAVIDPKTTPENVTRLRRLGARIELVDTADEAGGYLLARIERVRQLCASSPAFVWPDQYANPANPRAHELGTGPELVEQLTGGLDAVFVAVSTGGTLAGLARFLRRERPGTRIIAVDAYGSVALGGHPGPRLLTGIGASRASAFVSAELYDERVFVRDAEAFAFCRALASATGLAVGGSSGATLAACAHVLARDPDYERVVCLCADRGQSYGSTIYSDGWLARHGIDLGATGLGSVDEIAPAPAFAEVLVPA